MEIKDIKEYIVMEGIRLNPRLNDDECMDIIEYIKENNEQAEAYYGNHGYYEKTIYDAIEDLFFDRLEE